MNKTNMIAIKKKCMNRYLPNNVGMIQKINKISKNV